MTALTALVRKDLLLYLSDRRALLLNLLMPIVLATFFGYLFGGSGTSDRAKVTVGLVMLDTSEIGRKVTVRLQADPMLSIQQFSLPQARDQVREGRLNVAIVIPAGFGEAAGSALTGARTKPEVQIYYDPTQASVLAMTKGVLTQHVMQIVTAGMVGTPAPAAQDMRPSASAPAPAGGLQVPYSTREEAMAAGARYNGFGHSFAGMSVQFILFMGIDTGITILLLRRQGIWDRLLAAPISISTVLLSRAISATIIAFCLLCVIFAFAVVFMEVRIAGSLLGFAGIGLCFAMMVAAFGLFVAAFGKTPEAARGIAVFATLIMVILGGAWVPAFLFPQWLQSLTLFVPTRWAVDGLDAVTWRGRGFEAALAPMGILLGFALLFGVIAWWKLHQEEQRH